MTEYQGQDRRKYLTVLAVAQMWDVSADVIYGAIRKGSLPAYRVGSCLRVRVADALAFGSPVVPSSTEDSNRRL